MPITTTATAGEKPCSVIETFATAAFAAADAPGCITALAKGATIANANDMHSQRAAQMDDTARRLDLALLKDAALMTRTGNGARPSPPSARYRQLHGRDGYR
ncbi:MAG: hypothetical protein WAL04_06690 [Acidimicrobiales bacterium]